MTNKQLNILLFGILSFLVLLILWANWGFSTGRYLLYMDELVSFDGVKMFYNPNSWKHTYDLITVGGDVRYGRIFWLFPALISAIPTLIWGAKAQIITTRLIVAALQFISFYLLARTFIKSKTVRYLTLILLMVLPFTPYYMTMPKPEPYVLIFLTLFLLIWTQAPEKKRWAFFCLGLGFGAKVSVLPFLLYFFLLYTVFEALKKSLKPILTAGLSIIAGSIVANPYLLRVLSPKGIQQSIQDVAANAAHGSDSSAINVGSWLHYIVTDYFFSPPLLVFTFLTAIILIPALYTLYIVVLKKQFHALMSDPAIISLFIGLSFIFPVILRIKRLWGMYLHVGFVFLILATVIVIYQYRMQFKIKPLYRNFLLSLLCVFLLFESTSAVSKYIKLGSRTQSATHQQKETEYQYLRKLFNDAAIEKGRTINVLIDPNLYSFENEDYLNITRFWGPFIRFNEGADFILIYEKNGYKESLKNLSTSDTEYQSFIQSRQEEKIYLNPENKKGFHYIIKGTELPDLQIYYKVENEYQERQ